MKTLKSTQKPIIKNTILWSMIALSLINTLAMASLALVSEGVTPFIIFIATLNTGLLLYAFHVFFSLKRMRYPIFMQVGFMALFALSLVGLWHSLSLSVTPQLNVNTQMRYGAVLGVTFALYFLVPIVMMFRIKLGEANYLFD